MTNNTERSFMPNFNWDIFHWSMDYWHMTWEALGVIGLIITIYLAVRPVKTKIKLFLEEYDERKVSQSIKILSPSDIKQILILNILNKSKKEIRIKNFYLEFVGKKLGRSFTIKRTFQFLLMVLKEKPSQTIRVMASRKIFFDTVRFNGLNFYPRVVYQPDLIKNDIVPESGTLSLSEEDFIEVPFYSNNLLVGSLIDTARSVGNVRVRGVAIDGSGKKHISNIYYLTDAPIYKYTPYEASGGAIHSLIREANVESLLRDIIRRDERPDGFRIEKVKVERYDVGKHGNLVEYVQEYSYIEFVDFCKEEFPDVVSKLGPKTSD